MTKKLSILAILLIILVNSSITPAEELKPIEIFDPKQDRVVKEVPLNPEIYNMISNWIKNIDCIYGKIDPVTDDGYVVKIPLDPAIQVDGKHLNTLVDKVYIIVPENDLPFFMIFENKDRLTCFQFNGDIDALSKALGFRLKINKGSVQ
jgi:hypothetical protein